MIILPFHLKKLASYHTVLGLQLTIIFIVDFSDRLIGGTMKFKISDAANWGGGNLIHWYFRIIEIQL